MGPFPLQRIKKWNHPGQFLLAEGISDKELEDLLAFPPIGGLAILSPNITIGATATLRALPNLDELILCGSPITDEFVLSLAAMPSLRKITLVGTACTQIGVQRLLDAVKELRPYRAGPDSIYPVSLRSQLQDFISGAITQ